ncbi:ATP-binding protein [Flavobacterium sp. TR2]|uniref:tetratricopeptide repeat-containing sensor histidine kinase n=1 Tax=Flavobacterium sp. TR2 TaxID=2977321 RepID=UPI0021B0F303|nr:ATP-binding protein [Flavobacterium sp. TR2]UWY28109.1 ATP-binding protein [Flavobacterium sp. TR2]
MLRSPFFYLLTFLFFFSCKEKTIAPAKVDLNREKALKLRDLGIENLQSKNYNGAFYNFNKSKLDFEILKDSANIVYNLIQMASIQQINGDYYGSKETLTEALPYVKKKDIYSVSINNFFGIADKELALYDDAIYYYKEAIKDAENNVSKFSPLNNIAVIYIEQKKYEKAIQILESILNESQISKQSKARVLDNLGFAYFKIGNTDKGLALMHEGLKIRNEIQDLYGIIGSNLHLVQYYSKTNIQKSNAYAVNAYEIATKLNSIDERLKALSFLISNDSKAQNAYAQKFIFLNDSIIKVRNNFKNKFARIKYDSKKEKDENQKLRLEKAENLIALKDAENERNIFIACFAVFFFLLVYLKKQYDNRNRIEKMKTAYDIETRIAKDIHDGLANDVFHAITYTQTQPLANESNKENLLQKLDNIYSRVRGISRENNDIDTGSNFASNLKEMLSTYNSTQTNVIINGVEKINWDSVEDLKKIAIQRVLHELMVNMKKHSEAPVVSIKFDANANALLIDYSDNGKGCEKSKIVKNGLQNMENRILSNKGTITFDTEPNKGFKVKITMPK